jgi:hypothetical protein
MNVSVFNYIEACLWFFVSIILAFYAFRITSKNLYYKNVVIASIAFFAFGISDVIEAQTGAWWQPLSLLVLKGICIVVFLGCYFSYINIKRKNN